MKRLLLSIAILFSMYSCKEEEKKQEVESPELTVAEEIANAHGYANWDKVKSFAFTFGGAIEDPNSGRSWVWYPKSNDVTLTTSTDTVSYNRNAMDSIALKSDPAFINDKFWALIPFQLVWDEGITISESEMAISPVAQDSLNKIVIVYGDEGGYTPGDAYDIYFDNDYMVREWSFRKGNSPEPSLSNTFENYSDYNGIKVAQDHIFKGSGRNL